MLYVMLVGAYPFERPEDKHDNQKLQKMIQVRGGQRPRAWGGRAEGGPPVSFDCYVGHAGCSLPV